MKDDDLILDYEDAYESRQPLELATTGQRFANYLIDITIIMIVLVIVVIPITPIDLTDTKPEFSTLNYMLIYGVFLLYYTLLEFKTGKSIGKLITKTKVVTRFGEQPSLLNILGRSVCRFIPFEPISILFGDGIGWHDSISKTLVIQD